MKKKIYLIATAILLCLAAFTSKAVTVTGDALTPMSKEAIAAMTPEQKQTRLDQIKVRVAEIKAMDKSQMSKEDRKELKAELKEMKHESQAMTGGGIYLSVGAILIIILVLILIL